MTRTATCCCGACAIEVEGNPVINAICHCANCKRRTGSAFGWSAYFEPDQILRVVGEFKDYRLSGEYFQVRSFCPRCGTTLYWESAAYPDYVGVAGGCFTDSPLPEPTLTVANDGRCAWLTLPLAWATEVTD